MGEPMRFAVISPYVAAVLLREVSPARWRSVVEGVRMSAPGLAVEVERARGQLEAAAGQWREEVDSSLSRTGSGAGTSEVPTGADGGGSEHPPRMPGEAQSMSVAQVAGLLGVSPEYVRRLARDGILRGRKVAGRRQIEEDSVIEYSRQKRRRTS